MKRSIVFIWAMTMAALGASSCSEDKLPSNPVMQYPIKTLVVTVDNSDYTATPKGLKNDTLVFNVAEGREKATIKKLVLANQGDRANIAEGDEITFVEDRFTILLNEGLPNEHSYCLDMIYTKPEPPEPEPEYMFVVNSALKNPDGAASWLDPENKDSYPKLMPTAAEGKFEGHVYLKAYDWANLSFVKSDLTKYYNHPDAGFNTTYGVVSGLVDNDYTGDDNLFPSPGIWAGWAAGSGVWMLTVDLTAKELKALCTQWTIAGSAVSGTPQAMTYDADKNRWSATVSMVPGAFKFTTAPITAEDPVISYGTGATGLVENGGDITVSEAGSYTLSLDLSTAPDYAYSILKEGEEPEPDPLPFMYVVNSDKKGPGNLPCWIDPDHLNDRAMYPILASADKGATFEGYVDLSEYDWANVSVVKSDLKKHYSHSTEGLLTNQTYHTTTLEEMTPEVPNSFKTGGLWGNWKCAGGLGTISSQGVWKFNYNTSTKELVMLGVQWAIRGSAAADTQAMTYVKADRTWTLSATLAAGAFKFTTIAGSEGDPTLTYGLKADAIDKLAADGAEITVEAGNYTITLDLSNPTVYSYSLVKE